MTMAEKNDPRMIETLASDLVDRATDDWFGESEDDDADATLDCEMGICGDHKPYLAKDSRPLWSEAEPGVFSHFHASGARLPAGTYRCVMRHDRGVCSEARIEER